MAERQRSAGGQVGDRRRAADGREAPALRRAGRWLLEHRWLVLGNLYLLSPVLLYNLELRSGGRWDSVGAWLLLSSLLSLVSLQLLARRPLVFFVAASPFAVVVLADLFLIAVLDSRLTSSYLSVVAYNLQDAPEFARAYAPQLLVALGLFLPCYGLCLWRLRGQTLPARRRWAALPLALLVLLYAGVTARQVRSLDASWQRAALDVATHDTSSPFGVIPQLTVTCLLHREMERAFAERDERPFGVARAADAPSGPELYVLVIGESCRPDRWGLNGYWRDTSPRLARKPGLISFTDMVTQSPSTSESVPFMITPKTAADRAEALGARSVVSAFAEAGFRTYWFSTQEVSHWGGFIHRFADEAHVVRYFERRHDGALVSPVAEVADRLRAPGDRALVVLHTMGSHFAFQNRYPADFAAFPVRGSRRERLGSAYDNTVRYTDHVLAEVIERLEARPDLTSALLYASDHGENLLDDERQLFGHAKGTEHDLRVAAFAWFSPAYTALYPQAVARARRNRRAPLSTSHVFHSLADVARLRFPAARRELSVLSEALPPQPRWFVARGRVHDFDRLFGPRQAEVTTTERAASAPR